MSEGVDLVGGASSLIMGDTKAITMAAANSTAYGTTTTSMFETSRTSSFNCANEDKQRHQARHGMKRPRDSYSSPTFDHASDQSDKRVTKRRLNSNSSSRTSYFTNINNNNNDGRACLPTNSDDDFFLAEEVHTTPTALPQHSSFIQHQQGPFYQQTVYSHQLQHQSQLGQDQKIFSNVAATDNPSQSTNYATDYQPMNSLLGNLHLMRKQQQRTQPISTQVTPTEAQIRHNSDDAPRQHQPQSYNHRHFGTYHSLPTTPINTASSGKNRSRRNTVSLRVNSNLY